MKKIINIFIFLFIISGLFAKDTITWYVVPTAPFFITEGTDKYKGVHDLMHNYYVKKLKDYNHKYETVSINRLLEIAKKNDKFGTMILLKSEEREKTFYFSNPYDFILANHIIVKQEKYKDFLPYIDNQGYIDLVKLLADDKLLLGVSAGRVYHESLTDLLNKAPKLDSTFGLNSLELQLKKLSSNRISAIIEYPEVVQYALNDKKIKLDFVAIPIKGIEPYNLVRFSFPKTTWGEQMINVINNEISKYTNTKEYENLTLKLSPSKVQYLKEFRKISIKN